MENIWVKNIYLRKILAKDIKNLLRIEINKDIPRLNI